MEYKELTINKNYIYKGKILSVRKDDVKLINDSLTIREVVEHGGGSCVLCVKDNKILLVKQFRYPYMDEMWEIPAGKKDEGEEPIDTAKRELEEETGLIAKDLSFLFEVYPSPGYTNEKIYIFRASEFSRGKKHLDENEFLHEKWFSLSELKEMINGGKIKDAKTLIAILSEINK